MSSPLPDGEFGQKVLERLRDAEIVWFTTLNSRGIPQPNPVWFIWDGAERITVYSKPGSARLRNIGSSQHVSLHFNQHHAGDVVVLTGLAEPGDPRPAEETFALLGEKYREKIPRIGHDLDSFAASYSEPITVTIEKVRGF